MSITEFFCNFAHQTHVRANTYCEATVSEAVQQHDNAFLLHGFNVSVLR